MKILKTTAAFFYFTAVMFICEDFFFGTLGTFLLLFAEFEDFLGLFRGCAFDFFFNFENKKFVGGEAIQALFTVFLAADFDTGRKMTEKNATGSFVDFLTTAAGATHKRFGNIFGLDIELFGFLQESWREFDGEVHENIIAFNFILTTSLI